MLALLRTSTATIKKRNCSGYEEPVIIDCYSGKAATRYREGTATATCRGLQAEFFGNEAHKIIGKIGDLAQGLSPIQAGWLTEMTAVVEGEGHPPPDSKTRSTWHRGL